MSIPPSKPSGFGGGILMLMSKSKTNSPELFFSVKKSLTTSLTNHFLDKGTSPSLVLSIGFFYSLPFLTVGLFLHSWKMG